MAASQMAQFGPVPCGRRPLERVGAYGVVFGDNHGADILLVQWRSRYFLPGGGISKDESARQALRRELLEETGHEPKAMESLGRAGQYMLDPETGRYMNKVCDFFVVRVGESVQERAEFDHVPTWMPAHEAALKLHEEASAWAVQRAIHQ